MGPVVAQSLVTRKPDRNSVNTFLITSYECKVACITFLSCLRYMYELECQLCC